MKYLFIKILFSRVPFFKKKENILDKYLDISCDEDASVTNMKYLPIHKDSIFESALLIFIPSIIFKR